MIINKTDFMENINQYRAITKAFREHAGADG